MDLDMVSTVTRVHTDMIIHVNSNLNEWSDACSMARLDRVKNLTGLAEWFAGNKRLRKLVNLVIVGQYLLDHTPAQLSPAA